MATKTGCMIVVHQDPYWWKELADRLRLAVIAVPHGTGDSNFLRVARIIAQERAGEHPGMDFGPLLEQMGSES